MENSVRGVSCDSFLLSLKFWRSKPHVLPDDVGKFRGRPRAGFVMLVAVPDCNPTPGVVVERLHGLRCWPVARLDHLHARALAHQFALGDALISATTPVSLVRCAANLAASM